MSEPDVSDFVDERTRDLQRWHAAIARSSLLKIAVIGVLVVGTLAALHGRVDARLRRSRLLDGAAIERRELPAVAVLDRLDAATMALAREPFAGPEKKLDRAALDALVRTPGLYLRAVVDEVHDPRSIAAATHGSRKDAFLACLLEPPKDTSHETIRKAAIKYRWRVDLDALAPHVLDADVLDAGLRPAAASFVAEVEATHEPTALRLLEIERNARTPGAKKRAIDAARARWMAVVLDELPTGLGVAEGTGIVEAIKKSVLDEVLPVPHTLRVAIVDLTTGEVLLRLRTGVDARDLAVPNVMADAEEVHACQAAMATRAAAG